jgi:hypothetical protein
MCDGTAFYLYSIKDEKWMQTKKSESIAIFGSSVWCGEPVE